MLFMAKYTIRGAEEVQDENYDVVCRNKMPEFQMEAETPAHALDDAVRILQDQIDQQRRTRENSSRGMFLARVLEILDVQGNRVPQSLLQPVYQ